MNQESFKLNLHKNFLKKKKTNMQFDEKLTRC